MTTLHLGVVDVAYKSEAGATTTGEVAQYLEDEYHIMRVFLEDNQDKIGDWLAESIVGEIENLMLGKPVSLASKELPTNLGTRVLSGTSINGKIEERFRDFLAMREWKSISQQRVDAAESGTSKRKKHPYAKRDTSRAEFVDTGLYQASFRAWVD